MSIQDMKVYLSLCLKGQSTIPERKIMLNEHKIDLMKKISELNECVDFIDSKQQFYDNVLEGKVKYSSNLISVDD